MSKKKYFLLCLAVIFTMSLYGCASTSNKSSNKGFNSEPQGLSGYFSGVWQSLKKADNWLQNNAW